MTCANRIVRPTRATTAGDPMTQPQSPRIDPRTPLTDEAAETAAELERALRWAAEHSEDGLWTVAEMREMGRAA